jgi:hypothetical protein
VGEQHVGDAADVVLQLPVGEPPVLPGLVLRPDDGRLVAPVGEMAVHAVEGDVEAAAGEPGEVDLVVVRVEDVRPGVEPGEGLGLLAPEARGVVEGLPIEPLVLGHPLQMGPSGDGRLHGKDVLRQGALLDRRRRRP